MADSFDKSHRKNDENTISGTTNKRKLLNSSNDHQTGTKRIKLEPESDKEVKKKRKRKTDLSESNSDSNILEEEKLLVKKVEEEEISVDIAEVKTKKKKKKHRNTVIDINSEHESHSTDQTKNELEIYLEKRVKEEQMSSIAPEDCKKRKGQNFNSNFDSATELQPTLGLNSDEMENYLNLRVKEEQASEMEAEPQKVKKKKKKKHHLSSEMEDTNKSMSLDLKSINTESDLSGCVNQADTEYSVIDEKFSAEETIVEKRKKKHKKEKNKEDSYSTNDASGKMKEISRQFNGDISDIDTSLQPTDFTCNNIVSSTIINISTLETDTKQAKHVTDKIKESVLQHSNKYDRTTKISDRIRFEDDESLSQEPNSSKLSSRIQDFLKMHPHLRIEKTHSDLSHLITEDDEIWVVRCPRDMSYHKLKNNKLSLEGKCKIKIEGQTFEGVQNEDTNRITLLTNQHGSVSISNIPVKGFICYRKRIPKIHIPQDAMLVNNQTNFIPLPETKCRHPLFGDKYKKAIEIPMIIAKRLEAAKSREDDSSSKVATKKKHKKDKKKSLEVKLEENCSQEIDSIRRKKRKYSEDNDAPSKKRKKIKHDPDSPGAWESEKAIEENLFNF